MNPKMLIIRNAAFLLNIVYLLPLPSLGQQDTTVTTSDAEFAILQCVSQKNNEVELRIIVVGAYADAEKVISRLNNGELFSKLAKEESIHPSSEKGGEIGKFKLSDLSEELRPGLEGIEKGGYTKIIQLKAKSSSSRKKIIYGKHGRSQTLQAAAEDTKYIMPYILKAIPSRRLVISGKINLYEEIRTATGYRQVYSPVLMNTWGTFRYPAWGNIRYPTITVPYSYSYTEEYFTKDGNYFQKANYRNLKLALADNPEAMKYLRDYRKLHYLEIVLALTGVGIMLRGGNLMNNREQGGTITLVHGFMIANLAWIPHFVKENKKRKAIKAYNK